MHIIFVIENKLLLMYIVVPNFNKLFNIDVKCVIDIKSFDIMFIGILMYWWINNARQIYEFDGIVWQIITINLLEW